MSRQDAPVLLSIPTGRLCPPPTGQAPIGPLSRVASKGTFGVQAGEAAESPDGEDVPVACVADGTGLVEDPGDVFLGPITIGELFSEQTLDSSL